MSSLEKTRKRVGPVAAMVFNNMDISFFISLQNLINYVLICLENLPGASSLSNRFDELVQCAKEVECLLGRHIGVEPELHRLGEELVSEIRSTVKSLKPLSDSGAQLDMDSELLIISRSSSIQWAAVCLLEELRRVLQSRKDS